jgi:redox-sensitive bicupin YhaK (pirin superfamily)
MKSHVFKREERGVKDIGWLRSNFYFSFSDYYYPLKSAFGTLVAFNDDFVEAGKGFGIHPHINMEIISILLKGKMNHKDSMGYSTVIEAGGVQIMSAGSGLRHEEYNIGEEEVNFLQIWIQPKQQNIIPRYQQRNFPAESRKNKLTTIVSGEEGLKHCWINQNARLLLGSYGQNETIRHNLNKENMCIFVFVISGAILVDNIPVSTRDAIGIWDTGHFEITCREASEFLIIETPVNQK